MKFWQFVLLFGVCIWGLPVGVLFAVLFWAGSDPRPAFWPLFWLCRLTLSQELPPGPPFPPHFPDPSELSPAERGPPLRILFEWIDSNSDEPQRELIDLAEPGRAYFLYMAFGVGHHVEARVVGETPEAIDTFRQLMRLGGYTRADGPPPAHAKLYKPGD
jgi:hypothetical protein